MKHPFGVLIAVPDGGGGAVSRRNTSGEDTQSICSRNRFSG